MTLAEKIAAAPLWNPYDFANPVDDRTLFAGRETELKDIRYYLRLAGRAPRPINLVLAGPRSAGKTSLLNRIAHESQDLGFCVARIDLNEGDIDPFSLFYKVYDATLFAAASKGAFAGLSGATYESYRRAIDSGDLSTNASELLFPAHYAAASRANRGLSEPTLKADLLKISKELNAPCVLLFDECDVLGKSRIELELLRNVFMNTPGYMLVFAGTPNLFPVMEDVFSPIVRQFKKIPVERFSRIEDTEACIEKPLVQLGIDPAAVLKPSPRSLSYEVHRLSAGRPYEIQLLCHFMFKRVEDGDARDLEITLDVLDDVRLELEKQEHGSDRQSVAALHHLDHAEFGLLQALTAFVGTVPQLAAASALFSDEAFAEEDLQAAATKFRGLGLLRIGDDDVVRFSGDQFDEIYARYFAAANEKALFISKGDFQSALNEGMWDVFETTDVASPLYFLPAATPTETRRRLNDALEALIGDPPPPTSTLPEAASGIYRAVLDATTHGALHLANVRLSLMGTQVGNWVTLSVDEGEFLGAEAMVDLHRRVTALGGDLEVELIHKQVGPQEALIERVSMLASRNQLQDFAGFHARNGYANYINGDVHGALQQFEVAARFDADAAHVTSVAHTRLVLGDYAGAIDAAHSAREVANREDAQEVSHYLFATYDLAVALLMLDRVEESVVAIDEAKHLLETMATPPESAYLVAPTRENGSVILKRYDEVKMVDILPDADRFIREVWSAR